MSRVHDTASGRFPSSRAATSAIEFAILCPVFLLMLMGMLAYGVYFGASHSLQQIAADAARAAVAGLDEGERRKIVQDYLATNAASYPLIDPAKLTASADDDPAGDGEFTVAIRYDARDLPIWNLAGGLPLPKTTIVKRSVIRVGGL